MFIKIDQKSLDNAFRGLRVVLLGETPLAGTFDTRGRYRTYSLAVHGECLSIVTDSPGTFKGVAIDVAEGAADERYLKDLEAAEERLGKLIADLRVRKEAVKGGILDRNDLVTNTLRAQVIDPRTPPGERDAAQGLLGRVERIVNNSNTLIRDRARSTSTLNGRVAELETDNASLRAALETSEQQPPPAPRSRRRSPR